MIRISPDGRERREAGLGQGEVELGCTLNKGIISSLVDIRAGVALQTCPGTSHGLGLMSPALFIIDEVALESKVA